MMQIGTKIHGFTVTRVRKLQELQGRLWELEHDKTGAQLIWLDRADENKAFSIAFKTLPEDSTGVFHILEHSVLCGSDKYPVKEPFVELLKSSVQTFLNAFTYPDKTVYPISSRNDQDFLNLMDVYLDAVLHPAIYHRPEIFRQEGWRYERGEAGLSYQGVVLNEMKGAFGAPQEVLESTMSALLFPDNCYHFVSGGHPEHIPDLSYEQFIAMHRKYYHPSNARISLVGSVDLEAALEKIDSFLRPYEKQELDFSIPMQAPVSARTETVPYEIGAEEPLEERTVISCGRVLGRFDEREKLFAAQILADYLAGDNDAPLKRAILGEGLGQDLDVTVLDGTQQNVISWTVWNTDAEKLPQIRRVLRETLEPIATQGLDPQRLRACYNAFAFRLRDRDGGWLPRSLNEGLSALDTWLYDGDPAQALLVEGTLTLLAGKLEGRYFPKLLEELFLDDSHSVTAVLTPSHSLGEEKAQREAARIRAESEAWDDARKAQLDAQAESLRLWQQTPDSEAALATIPVLQLSDLADRPAALPVTVTERGGRPLLRHGTSGSLVAFKTIFRSPELPLERLPELATLAMVLGKMGTDRHSGEQLQMLVKERIGKLIVAPKVLPGSDAEHCQLLFAASVLCLPEQAEAARELLEEILCHTAFTDRRLLRDLLQQGAMGAQMALSSDGHRYAMTRVASYGTAYGAAKEHLSGTAQALWLKQWSKAGDGELDELLERLAAYCRGCFVAEGLSLSCTENTPEGLLDGLLAAFPDSGTTVPAELSFAPLGQRQEGITIPAQVGYASRGASLKRMGLPYRGSFPVLANVLNYNYLWSEIRVQGGAYGCGFVGRDDGDLSFYTYRDPKPGRSLQIMEGAAQFVRDFCAGDPDLTGSILGAVSALDPLLTEEDRRNVAEDRWFKGVSYEKICSLYSELVHTTPEDLLALCPVLEQLTAARQTCVIAGPAQLDACGEQLTERISV